MNRLTSMLLCHFILDLRSLYVVEDPDTGIIPSQPVISTVRFAESFVGNMGALLNTPWESEDDAQTTVVFERDDDASVYYDETHTSIAHSDVEEKPEVWEAV